MTEAIVLRALTRWGFDSAPARLIAQRENKVYRVETHQGPVALRLHRPGLRTPAELRSELDWMQALSESGVAVPAPIPALDRAHLAEIDGQLVDVLTWLDGAPMSDGATPEDYGRLGALIARMHDIADAWTLPPGFTRPNWDAPGLIGDAPLWERFWDNPTLDPTQADLLRRFRDHARSALAALRADTGLIHADLVPDNVLISQGTPQPIDFDDGGFGYRLFDLATVTHRSRRSDPGGDLAARVTENYAAHRPLDRNALPLFEALRACTYVGWIVPRLSEPGGPARNARFVSEACALVARFLPA